MDRANLTPRTDALSLRVANIATSATMVMLGCGFYLAMPYNQKEVLASYGPGNLGFTGQAFLIACALAYCAALAVYFLMEHAPGISKSLRCFLIVASFIRSPTASLRRPLTAVERLALLTSLLKLFFAPLMVMSLMMNFMGALRHGSALIGGAEHPSSFMDLFDRHGFWILFQLIFFVDLLIFTVGYLVEVPRLKNEIRSVDSTLLGWAAALLCYPPFNQITAAILGSVVSDFPRFDDRVTHVVLNLLMLGLLGVYAMASIALGFKASNLTHRGIVSKGPYAVVRHPAYVCKNVAWWIGAAPLVATAFSQSPLAGVSAVASVVGWSMVYVVRALTEEDHLRSVDGDYAAYAARVRYRFIPGVL